VRLACVRHAASVNSEPGSNSPVLLGVFPHSGSLFSFQRASFANYYCNRFFAAVKRFVRFSSAPLLRGNCLCNRYKNPCQAPFWAFFTFPSPRGFLTSRPQMLNQIMISYQIPPASLILKKVVIGQSAVNSQGSGLGLGDLYQVETSVKCHFVILSEAKDLVFTPSYEILRSLCSLRMTGEGTFAEISSRNQTGGTGVSPVQAQSKQP
jgi:hypothetical protein